MSPEQVQNLGRQVSLDLKAQENNPLWFDALPSSPSGVTASPPWVIKVALPMWFSARTPLGGSPDL